MRKLLFVLMLFTSLFVLFGCKTKIQYVPVETLKTEYRDKYLRDSIYLMDSVFVDRWRSNDTVYLTKEKYKYLYKDKIVRDTINIRDSIRVSFPVVEEVTVKAPYTWYEKILMILGGIFIGYLGFKVKRFF